MRSTTALLAILTLGAAASALAITEDPVPVTYLDGCVDGDGNPLVGIIEPADGSVVVAGQPMSFKYCPSSPRSSEIYVGFNNGRGVLNLLGYHLTPNQYTKTFTFTKPFFATGTLEVREVIPGQNGQEGWIRTAVAYLYLPDSVRPTST